MKKSIILIAFILIISFISVVLANGINLQDEPEQTEVINYSESSAQSNLTMKENMRTADSFSSVMDCTAGTKYANVSAYVIGDVPVFTHYSRVQKCAK